MLTRISGLFRGISGIFAISEGCSGRGRGRTQASGGQSRTKPAPRTMPLRIGWRSRLCQRHCPRLVGLRKLGVVVEELSTSFLPALPGGRGVRRARPPSSLVRAALLGRHGVRRARPPSGGAPRQLGRRDLALVRGILSLSPFRPSPCPPGSPRQVWPPSARSPDRPLALPPTRPSDHASPRAWALPVQPWPGALPLRPLVPPTKPPTELQSAWLSLPEHLSVRRGQTGGRSVWCRPRDAWLGERGARATGRPAGRGSAGLGAMERRSFRSSSNGSSSSCTGVRGAGPPSEGAPGPSLATALSDDTSGAWKTAWEKARPGV